jgi:GAF domain-containing protein
MYNIDTIVKNEVEAVSRMSIIPILLEIVCRTTGMGFAAVARVTEEQWIACGVKDEIKFGLLVGDELKVDTTICHEIRQSGEGVVIDNVDEDEFYRVHHTPAKYGFKSYISIPITRQDQRFFGTLCAIDPRPALLNTPEIIGMLKTYARLISFHLNAREHFTETKVRLLEDHAAANLKQLLATLFSEDQSSGKMSVKNRNSNEFALLVDQSNTRVLQLIDSLQLMSETGS